MKRETRERLERAAKAVKEATEKYKMPPLDESNIVYCAKSTKIIRKERECNYFN